MLLVQKHEILLWIYMLLGWISMLLVQKHEILDWIYVLFVQKHWILLQIYMLLVQKHWILLQIYMLFVQKHESGGAESWPALKNPCRDGCLNDGVTALGTALANRLALRLACHFSWIALLLAVWI